ncbi:Tetratricopeptide repeat protein 21B [Halotydeus destructor]|nr:Tetratricopeptide repeat protein 21B [Halotydeus destructor]
MSEKELVLRSTIHYYCYRGFYRSMQNAALEGVRLYANEHKYRFYYGISLTFEGRIQESIRELDALQDNRDLSLGCLLALIHAHRQCKAVDKEAIGQFEVTLRDTRKSANETSLYFAGLFLMFIKKFEKARDYVDRMYKMAPSFREGLIAKGWLELEYAKEMVEINEVAKYFDAAANHGDPEALLGKAAITERTGNYGAGVEYLNRAIANYHAFVPAFIEKIKLHVAMKDWEDALDTIARTQNLDRHCIDAKRYSLLHTLVWETLDDDQSESKLSDLLASLELREPKNLNLFLRMLSYTHGLPRHFKNATKFDQSNLSALVGLLYNNILENPSNSDAIEQLDALEEFNHSQGLTNELLYLCALTGEKRGKTETEVLKYLDQIAGKLIDALNHMPVGLDFYMVIDPEMTCDVVQLYLEHAPADPISHGQPLPHVLKMSNELLSPVINSCPSLKQPLFLMA